MAAVCIAPSSVFLAPLSNRTIHTPLSHLMVGAPCTNLDTEQLSIPFDPIVLPFPQLGDQSLVLFQLEVVSLF